MLSSALLALLPFAEAVPADSGIATTLYDSILSASFAADPQSTGFGRLTNLTRTSGSPVSNLLDPINAGFAPVWTAVFVVDGGSPGNTLSVDSRVEGAKRAVVQASKDSVTFG